MRRPQLRSPLARAVVPVLAGIAFLAVLGLILFAVAVHISHDSKNVSSDFAPSTFDVGRTSTYSDVIAADGPLIFPDLLRANGKRTIVLDHTGDDPQRNWNIYMAYPADRDVSCKVTQIKHTRNFIDCTGRTVATEALARPPAGVYPEVFANGTITLHLLPASAEPAATVATS
ncbi:MAG TPA: hypothetical protein VGM78_14080 [Ilumatobacteraceae bacterium]